MTFDEYQLSSRRTQKKKDEKHTLIEVAIGLSAESGEFANLLKKHLFQGHAFSADKAIDEGGDVLWYLALLCDVTGISLEEMAKRNVQKLLLRYPEGFSDERSINRKEDK